MTSTIPHARYWVSWWSGNYADEGCTRPPFPHMISGTRDRNDDSARDEVAMVAWLRARDPDAIWALVRHHFPDAEERFCNPAPVTFAPGSRFPDLTEPYTID